MKTTLELPDDLFQSAKIAAAAQGRPLKDLFTEALREKLARPGTQIGTTEPAWMRFFGSFGKSAAARADNKLILAAVDEEFGQLEPNR